jgi:hypothetical protein
MMRGIWEVFSRFVTKMPTTFELFDAMPHHDILLSIWFKINLLSLSFKFFLFTEGFYVN